MLETTLTTTDALRYSLAMSGLALITALGILAITVYLLIEWRRDLNGLKTYLEENNITDKEQ